MQSIIHDDMGKKGKAPTSEKTEMIPLFIDTGCTKDAGISIWEAMYKLLEEENPRIMKVTVTADGRGSSEASLTELACLFLHRIAARPKIIPYTDMVKLIIDHADIFDREFKMTNQQVMGSFSQNNLRHMYHLLEPQASYNKQFVEKFAKENEDMEE